MGYAHYTLPDGREAGYGVQAECDAPGCVNMIDRGLSYLCGETPDGHRDPSEHGCGNYFCTELESHHDCPNPACGEYSDDGNLYCQLARGHAPPHVDAWSERAFTEAESDSD